MSTGKTSDDEQSAAVAARDEGLAAALKRLAGLTKAVAPQWVKWFDVGKGFGFVQPDGGRRLLRPRRFFERAGRDRARRRRL